MFSTQQCGLSWEKKGLVQTLQILPVFTNFSRFSQICFSQWLYDLIIIFRDLKSLFFFFFLSFLDQRSVSWENRFVELSLA